jgi:hypothetical protein
MSAGRKVLSVDDAVWRGERDPESHATGWRDAAPDGGRCAGRGGKGGRSRSDGGRLPRI